jgi:hypothetical protein
VDAKGPLTLRANSSLCSSIPLSTSRKSRAQEIDTLIRHSRNVLANGARRDLVGRDGDKDTRIGDGKRAMTITTAIRRRGKSSRRGRVLNEVDTRG